MKKLLLLAISIATVEAYGNVSDNYENMSHNQIESATRALFGKCIANDKESIKIATILLLCNSINQFDPAQITPDNHEARDISATTLALLEKCRLYKASIDEQLIELEKDTLQQLETIAKIVELNCTHEHNACWNLRWYLGDDQEHIRLINKVARAKMAQIETKITEILKANLKTEQEAQ